MLHLPFSQALAVCVVFASLFSPADRWDVLSSVPHLEAFANLQKSAGRASAACFYLPFYFMDLTSLGKSWVGYG